MKKILGTFLAFLLSFTLVMGTTCAATFAAAPTVLFSDDFQSGTLSVADAATGEPAGAKWRWTTADNSAADLWVIENGSLKMSGTVGGSRKTGIMYAQGGDSWTDYIVEYEFTNAEYMSFSSLYFRCTPSANKGYFLHFVGSAGDVSGLKLFKLTSSQTEVASAPDYALSSDEKHTIRIELKGNKIDIYVDDGAQPVITYTDTAADAITSGGVAIRNSGDGQYIDNFVVTDNTAEVVTDFESIPLTGTDVYSTDFDPDTFEDNWSKLSGTTSWAVEATGPLNSTPQLKLTQTDTKTTMYRLGTALKPDYAIGFDLATEWNDSGFFSVYFKAISVAEPDGTKVTEGYELYYSKSQKKMYLNRVSGKTHTKVTGEYSIDLNKTRKNIKILAYGKNIDVRIDDIPVLTYVDETPYSGGGIYVRNYMGSVGTHNAYIDNFQVVVEDLVVTASSIEDGTIGVDINPSITLSFNRAIGESDLEGLEITDVTNDIPVTNIQTNVNEKNLVITFPGSLTYYTTYRIDLPVAVQGEDDEYSVSFTTKSRYLIIKNLAVTKIDNSPIGELKDETAVNVTVTVENTDEAKEAKIFVAAYANDGVMRGIGETDTVELSSLASTDVPVTVENLAFAAGDTNCRLVAFVWSADGKLTPLAVTASYPGN